MVPLRHAGSTFRLDARQRDRVADARRMAMGGVGDDAYHDARRGRDITVDIHCVLELTDFK